VEKEITFMDIFNTLKMESKVDKTTKAKAEEISGWLSAVEMKDMLQIVNQKENPNDDLGKREMLQNKLVKQQSIALAKAANIGLHLSLWNGTEEDDNLCSNQTKVEEPLKNLKIVNEASLLMLKNPGRNSTSKLPPVLNSVQEELQKGANRLSQLCRADNCDYWTDTAMAFSQLSKQNIVPSYKRWEQVANDEKAMLEEPKPTLPGWGVASALPQIPRIPLRKSDPVTRLNEDLIMPFVLDSEPTATPSSQGDLATSQNPPPVVGDEKEKHPTVEVTETKPIETPTTPTISVVEQVEVVPPPSVDVTAASQSASTVVVPTENKFATPDKAKPDAANDDPSDVDGGPETQGDEPPEDTPKRTRRQTRDINAKKKKTEPSSQKKPGRGKRKTDASPSEETNKKKKKFKKTLTKAEQITQVGKNLGDSDEDHNHVDDDDDDDVDDDDESSEEEE
jgi:hypothetical protein